MRLRTLGKIISAGFFVTVLAACGGGSSNSGCAAGNPDCNTGQVGATINALGVDGPLLDAAVDVFALQDYLDNRTGATSLLASARRSDAASGLVDDIELVDSAGVGPFVLVVTADGATTDLTTGAPPVLGSVTTVITEAEYARTPQPRFYATSLTTLAFEQAISRAASNTDIAVLAQLDAAQTEIKNLFGFGITPTIDLFTTPAVIDGTTTSNADQQAVAEHRIAIETFAAVVGELIGGAAGASGDAVVATILADIADGVLDNTDVFAEVILVDADYLINDVTPARLTTDIQALLDGETPIAPAVNGTLIAVPTQPDSDQDGLPNDVDAEPQNNDADGDGVLDGVDNCPALANPDQENLDGDAFGDVCDDDVDGDGIDNSVDNCPLVANPGQENLDGDAFGDVCDNDADSDGADGDGSGGPSATDSNDLDPMVTIDSDGDGVDDLVDNCPLVANPGQENLDGDAFGDACDDDVDGDGIDNSVDNCPLVANPGQENLDGDAFGNVCDNDADGDGADGDGSGGPSATDVNDLDPTVTIDSDGDGVDDLIDNCPLVANPGQENLDGDAFGNVCDNDADGDGADGDGSGGPSATDANDLDPTVTIDSDGDGVDDLIDNCPLVANPGQENLDGDAFGNVCDNDADGDGADGDGSGGPSPTDSDDLDPTVTQDGDNDGIDDSVDNCPLIANPGQENQDGDAEGDACDNDDDNDSLLDGSDPEPLSAESRYHFDFFYNQASSDGSDFKVATIGETVSAADGSIDIGVNLAASTALNLMTDETGNGSFDVVADYRSLEESLSFSGLGFAAATGTPVTASSVLTADNSNASTLSGSALSFTGESPVVSLNSWGINNFVGAGRVTLDGVGSTLTTAFEQSISVLSFSDNASDDADLNGDYGFVELSVTYSDVEASALVALNSRVFDVNADGLGALTTGTTNSAFTSSLGLSDGSVGFDATAVLASTYTVSTSGAVQLVLDTTLNGFTDSDGDLITLVDANKRVYGAKLGAGVGAPELDGVTFDLNGLVIESSNASLTASNFVGATLAFTNAGTLTAVLSGTVVESRATFDSADVSLPTLTSGDQAYNETSDAITVAGDGSFTATFSGSATNPGLELEGFYTANGRLLVRVMDTLEIVVTGGSGGPSIPGLQSGSTFIPVAEITGGVPQVCDPDTFTPDDPLTPDVDPICDLIDVPACELDVNGIPTGGSTFCPLLLIVTLQGDINSGYWTLSGGGGTSTSTAFTSDARLSNQIFTGIPDSDEVRITQGLLFGTPQ